MWSRFVVMYLWTDKSTLLAFSYTSSSDLPTTNIFVSSANKKTNLDKKIARQYCENPPWNFSIICNLAGLEPEYVTYKLKQKLK